MKSFNPADGSVVFAGVASSDLEIELAIGRAVEAGRRWAATSLDIRVAVLRGFAAYVAANAEALTQLLMCEIGKLRADAASEVAACVAKVEITIELASIRAADQDSSAGDTACQIRHRPIGVILVLGPFNFPAHLPGGQIVPALLAGNAIVFKPSELSPAVGRWIADAWTAAGLPHGVLNLIQGGAPVAQVAIADQRIDGVLFTGGYRAGASIHRQLAGRPHVLLALEMGGNNPLVICPPYEVEKAVQTIIASTFVSAGQRCTCARRLIVVQDDAGQRLIDHLVDQTRLLACGLPLDDPPVAIGPVVSAAAGARLLESQQSWIDSGGIPLLESKVSARSAALLSPGIIDMTDAAASDEESFGPLLQVYRVSNFDAAIDLAARTRFGLAAGLIGGNEAMFEAFRARVGAGIVNWNLPLTGASSRLPFGGIGCSGNHRPAGAYAIDFCHTPVASMTIHHERPFV